jgi:predicted Zn finger-like uncharacterized protein
MEIETEDKSTMTARCPACKAVNNIVKEDFRANRKVQVICVNCKNVITFENPSLSPT